MKNTIKILVSAFIVAASASSFVGSANSASMKMSKDDMMAMKPMMCKMHSGMGTETYACFSEPMAKQMMMKKHLKMHSMMCKQSGMGSEQYDCLSNSKYKTMMKHM